MRPQSIHSTSRALTLSLLLLGPAGANSSPAAVAGRSEGAEVLLGRASASPQGPEQAGHPAGAPVRPERPPISVFGTTLSLGDTPPEVRALRIIQLRFEGTLGSSRRGERTREQAELLAADLRGQVLEGADFGELAKANSDASNAVNGGLMGVMPPGVLGSELDRWLFASELYDVSPVLPSAAGMILAQRIPERIGARVIFVNQKGPEGFARIRALLTRLENGEDFASLASEVSDDLESRARGGAQAIFERGSADSMVKAAAFDTPLGRVSAPVETPLGLYLVQPVPPESLPQELFQNPWVRMNGILISFDSAKFAGQLPGRTAGQAELLADDLFQRLRAGADFGEIAAQYNDDPSDGRGRRGDVGWFHRQQPGVPSFVRSNFSAEISELIGPIPTNVGYLILQRTR